MIDETPTSHEMVELWGGVECTVVRIRDTYRDQSIETGHRDRLDDLDRISDLGIRTVRYPILWEQAAKDCSENYDFTWPDQQLARLRELGIEVIGGLIHHGSGPMGTDLLDPAFPEKFARFAAAAAKRYPWITQWTPVNEPLTTARFSALYGHWYPHSRRWDAFARALINQCLATVRGMAEIRRHIPNARLVQTEDIGRTFSTPALSRQADHDNRRSWLSLDLLFGRVDPEHPMYSRLRRAGISASDLAELARGEGRPDLIGVNHYLTSDRYLDERADLYPREPVGGNGRERYVDLEAVRFAELSEQVGIEPRLREVWDRYQTPIAVTEVHHGCTHDEQLRWLVEVWDVANRLRADGVDIRAITLWSMFGNVDWRSLLTREDGHYDSGVFDARTNPPRPTILATAAKTLSSGKRFEHPILASPGWWRRPDRFYIGREENFVPQSDGAPLLITGATGTLGKALTRVAHHRGLPVQLTSRADLNLEDASSIRDAIERYRPWAIVNAAGFVRVADAENDREGCFAANAGGVIKLADVAAEMGIPIVGFSSDLVFDGSKGPYSEGDACKPTSVYGESKRAAELALLGSSQSNLVVRTAAFFGPWDCHNFAWHTLTALKRGEKVEARDDVRVSPTYVPDLCHAVLNLLVDGTGGLWHIANPGSLSWFEFAQRLAEEAGADTSKLVPISGEASDTTLVSVHGALLRPVDAAISDYCRNFAQIEETFREQPAPSQRGGMDGRL